MSREAARIVAAGNKIPPQAERKAARTCKKLPVASFCASETAERMPLGAAEGFNWACAKPPLRRAESRFAEPRSFLKKVLIVAVRSCGCGALIRGLENLGASYEGVRVVTFCIVQKVTKKHAGLRPATCDSKLCRRRFQQSFPTARAEIGFSHKTAAKRL